MDGLYFLAMLVGIAWLAVWAVRSEPGRRDAFGWLFDMRDADRPEAASDAAPTERDAVRSWRDRAARSPDAGDLRPGREPALGRTPGSLPKVVGGATAVTADRVPITPPRWRARSTTRVTALPPADPRRIRP